jgi:thiol reductant ABC exporter CydD subunit
LSAADRRPRIDARLLGYDPGARRRLLGAVAAGFVAAMATIAAAWLMSQVIAGVFLDAGSAEAVAPLLGLLAVAAVVRAAGLWLLEVLAQRAGGRIHGRLRGDLVDRTFRLGPSWVSERRAGDLASVLTAGLDATGAWMALYQPARLLAGSVPLLVLLVVVLIDPLSSLVLIFTGPVLLLLLAVIGSRTQAISDRRFAELRWLSAFFVELLRGLPTLRAFGRSREQADTLRQISDRLRVSTMDVLRSAFQTGLVLDWGGAVAMALVAVQIGLRLMADAIPFDRALAVLFITPEFFLPLRQLAVRYHAGSAGRTAATEVFAILDEPVPGSGEARPSPPAVTAGQSPPPGGPSAIRFDGVSVRYPGRGPAALDRLTLDVPAGARVAIVGATGAGKTTLARLLMRFVEPDEGSILVRETPLVTLDAAAWRARVGWVPQAPHLFHGTIADNLRIARPDATDRQLRAALEAAQAIDLVDELPEGIHTHVGEGGVRLSGGERQRVAIARALVRESPFLLLDEPTAHLDPETEDAIATTLARQAGARTVIVISHRLRLAIDADLVAVLHHGRLVEAGPPGLLLASGGAFAVLRDAETPEAPAA